MQDEVIHALPLAFSDHGAHFNDLRARAKDDGDHGSLADVIINEYVPIFILPPFFLHIPLDAPIVVGDFFDQRVFCFYILFL
jgi:hypothetical protein